MTVGIVGMGAAGLLAALRLQEAGIKTKLFEARQRTGGRIHTIRVGDLQYDAGGEWLDADHERCLTLCNDFGLEMLATGSWPRDIYYGEEHCTEATLWSEALEDDLRVEAAARELCRNLKPIPWENLEHGDLDEATLGDFLRASTHSARGLWWKTAQARSDEGDEPDRIGLLGWLCGYRHYLERDDDVMSAYRVQGGMQRLTDAIADRIVEPIQLGKVLKRVAQDQSGVTLEFEGYSERVDRAILTLPPPALERVIFDPALPKDKRCAVEACGMSRTIKIVLEFSEPWWMEMGSRGSIHTILQLQQLWQGSHGGRPVLTSYICGDDADFYRSKTAAVRHAYEELLLICPQAEGKFVGGWLHDWVGDPYAFGGFSHLAPGYVLEHMRHMPEAYGNIHFAGEHTASWTGFIEGAFESADRVVDEVLNA
ncbi:MAG TPA: NAD(P)/FAD-dependent oxidoreductase [Fimbriimonadaceae bacterium]|nr:NAD(P)/FAD-dependent oxidoreductase [Fimbriimonadaceae bacterium]